MTYHKLKVTICERLTWNDERLYAAVKNTISSVSFPVVFDESLTDGSAYGFYDIKKKEIHIRPDISDLHTLKTLVHELSHAVQYNEYADYLKTVCRNEEEVIAESCAFCVLHMLAQEYGISQIDSSEYSFGYVASWGSRDMKELKKCITVIQEISNKLFEIIRPAFAA